MSSLVQQMALRCWKCRSELRSIGVNGVTHYFCDKCKITYELVSRLEPSNGEIREYLVIS
jgi:hypothetical protein